MLSRRNLLAAAASLGVIGPLHASEASALPATGTPVPTLDMIDRWVRAFMDEHAIEGAALAIAKDGRMVYARGFGMADVATRQPVAPDALFRAASISKPVTAVGVLQLVEAGRLDLDEKVLDLLPWAMPSGGLSDPRWADITVAHCLTHAAGFDRDTSGDPTVDAGGFAQSAGLALPINVRQVIRVMASRPLDFAPGMAYSYSNFGYALLGRVIEEVSGREYEDFIASQVLGPAGITRVAIGGSRLADRMAGEVTYYGDFESVAVVGPGAGQALVGGGDGAWDQRMMDAHGGWVFSAPDLARFGVALDRVGDGTRAGLLPAAMADRMLAQQIAKGVNEDGTTGGHYGYGWIVRPGDDGTIALHNGTLPTTGAMLLHFPNGTNMAFLTNNGLTPDGRFVGRILQEPLIALHDQARAALSAL